MEVLALIATLSLYIIYQIKSLYQKDKHLSKYFISGLIFKLLAGLLVCSLYQCYYGLGDMLSLFESASQLANYALANPLSYVHFWFGNIDENLRQLIAGFEEVENIERATSQSVFFGEYRNIAMTKVVSLVCLATRNNFWFSSLYISLFSFAGCWFLFLKLYVLFPEQKWAGLIAFIYFPSIVFWTSGLIKEALVTGAVNFISSFLLQRLYIDDKKKAYWQYAWYFLYLNVLFYLVWQIKYYYVLAWVGGFLPFIFVKAIKKLSTQQAVSAYLAAVLVFSLTTLLLQHERINLLSLIDFVIKNNREALINASEGSLIISYYCLKADIFSLALNALIGGGQALFRPFLWESYNTLTLLAALESSALLFLTVAFLLRIRQIKIGPKYYTLVLATCVYLLVLLVFTSFAMPHLGTMVRLRVGMLGAFVYFLCVGARVGKNDSKR